MYQLIRNLLFRMPPETAHDLTLRLLALSQKFGISQMISSQPTPQPTQLMGLTFPNPVGLAAGLDKNGHCIAGLASLGFGFLELGTVTPKPQPGNPQPRLFRLPEEQAIINRMGFNNAGVEALLGNYLQFKTTLASEGNLIYQCPVGINVGKNLSTSVEDAHRDYARCIRLVYPHADYITANVSSPNTPGLRNLQFGDAMKFLLNVIKETQLQMSEVHNRYVPIAVKIAPDMEEKEIRFVAETLKSFSVDAVIATNTTIDRSVISGHPLAHEQGGLSGAPLRERSTAVVKAMCSELGDSMPIIAAGGIHSGQDAVEKIKAGAKLVQIYTGFIYQGPALIKEAADAILRYRLESK